MLDSNSYSSPRMYLTVCPHINHHLGHYISTNPEVKVACRISHLGNLRLNSSCSTCSGVQKFGRCPTDFQIDMKDFGKNVTALVITRLLDLGEGRTPLDPKWITICGLAIGDTRMRLLFLCKKGLLKMLTNKALILRNCCTQQNPHACLYAVYFPGKMIF